MSGAAASTPSKGSFEEKAIELIGSKEDGLRQSELRRLLGIESSRCSRVVRKLERSGIIWREKPLTGNRRTYLIRLSNPGIMSGPDAMCDPAIISDLDIKRFGEPLAGFSIDTYLTEIYLHYLIRGSRTGCPEGWHEGFSGDTAADELSDGRSSSDHRAADRRGMVDRNCSTDLSSSVPVDRRGKCCERLLRQGDRCSQQTGEANSQRTHQPQNCSEMVLGLIRSRLRTRWPRESDLPGNSRN